MTIKLYQHLKTFVKMLLRHLWLSISSVQFYQDVYSRYKGYGLKYLFATSFIASLFIGTMILNYLDDVKDYFINDNVKHNTANIDHILKQMPDIYYDGSNIQIEEETPLIIKDMHLQEIIAIDPAQELESSKKNKIPIVFLSNKINISPAKFQKKPYIITIKYSEMEVFGSDEKVITQDSWKNYFAKVTNNATSIFIYLLYPLLLVMYFILSLCNYTFIVILISTYLLSYFLLQNTSLKSCFRMVAFACGTGIALTPAILISIPEDIGIVIVSFLQSWPLLLLFLSILKTRNEQ